MSETPKLLPCPFCGGEAESWFDDLSQRRRIACGPCGASSGVSPRDKSESPAVAAWNRRASSSGSVSTAEPTAATPIAYVVRSEREGFDGLTKARLFWADFLSDAETYAADLDEQHPDDAPHTAEPLVLQSASGSVVSSTTRTETPATEFVKVAEAYADSHGRIHLRNAVKLEDMFTARGIEPRPWQGGVSVALFVEIAGSAPPSRPAIPERAVLAYRKFDTAYDAVMGLDWPAGEQVFDVLVVRSDAVTVEPPKGNQP